MKIAYVYDAVYPWVKGGAEKRVYELSRRLANRGHDVHCFGIKWWKGNSVIQKDGVFLHGICNPRYLYSGDRRSMREALAFAWKVLVSSKGDYDLIDCQEFPYLPCFSAKLVAAAGKTELFITWLEVWGDYWYEYMGKKGLAGKSIETAVARLTDKNIAISERTRKGLEELGVCGVRVVPIGIDFKDIERIRAAGKTSEIIYAGRLLGHKNVNLLISALQFVKREIPDVRTIIIGDGPEYMKLKHLAMDLGLHESIKFTGFLENYDEVISLMKSSKVFVMPSTREGFGIAALEANACGLPVVTSNHRMNAVCDLVTEGTGLICEPSVEDLSEAIIRVLDESTSMRARCVELAKGCDWDRIIGIIEKVYEGSG
jgi:glycosyltransferase involved in cell wall biosynthesis